MTKIMINTIIFQKELQTGISQYTLLNHLKEQVDGIEVRGELFSPETETAELAQIQALAQKKNYLFFYSIPEQAFIKNELNDHLEHYFKLAHQFGISSLKISLGEIDIPTKDQVTSLNHLIKTYDVQLTLENEPNNNGQLTHLLTVLEQLSAFNSLCGYTFDSGNWYWIDESPIKALAALSDYVSVFHLKNIVALKTVSLSEGTKTWQTLCQTVNPEVPIILEYPVTAQMLTDDLALLRTTIETRA